MKYQVIPPPLELAPHVKFFWSLESREEYEMPYRLFADACPTMVFHYYNTFRKTVANNQEPNIRSVLHGHTCTHEDMIVSGSFGIFGIYFFPMAIDHLFDTAPRELLNKEVNLYDLMGREGLELEEKMMMAQDNQERVKLVSQFLIKKSRCAKIADQLMTTCLEKFIQGAGTISIGQMAAKSSWSPRHLQRRFERTIGLPPKMYSRVLRFQYALKCFERGKCRSLADLVHFGDYFDQSHMIREFKSFAGMSPKQYFKNCPEIAEGFAQIGQ